jgi:aerobic carbon-monoxide dehydrogenase large subunit
VDKGGGSWVGTRLPRREDPTLLMGRTCYLADLVVPRMLHAVFLRSPYAHAVIDSIDSEHARSMSGVHAVLTAKDFPPDLGEQPCTHLYPGQRATPYYALAKDRVRYVGEPVAIVVADSPYLAEDARDAIEVNWHVLPGVGNADVALAADAARLYDDWPDNVAAVFEAEMGDIDLAFEQSDVVVSERFCIQRHFACPLETRGVLADWELGRDELTIWTSSQIVHIARDLLASVLHLPEHRIRVLIPQVGGGFGAKFHFYPEEVAVALASRATGRPVRWVEDRMESFVATVHAREQIVEATMCARHDGRITGVKADIIGDMGAALHTVSYGPVWLTSVMMTNIYEIPNVRVRARAVVTNKTPLGSFRGWGQPQANFVVERLVERVARNLELDSAQVRRRNFVPPDRFPYKSLVHVFDSGRYERCLNRAMALLDERDWSARQRELRQQGRYVGIGLSFYVENTALGPSRILNAGGVEQGGYDIGHVRIEPGGEVTIFTGLCEMGQGFTGGLIQICADQLGVHPEQVTVVTGDTSTCPYTGYGTGGSRSTAVGGAAVMKACATLREKIKLIASHMLEASPHDLEMHAGKMWVKGLPDRYVTMADVGRAAYLRMVDLPDGMDPGLEAIEVFDPPQMAWPYGVNIAVVEVDVETGLVSFLDYVYVHDCGTIINPMIVDGQIHGGVAQGIGAALYEDLPYREDGQPLFATFMDYVLPTASEVPRIRLAHEVTPSPIIPGGMKGVGESGVIGSPAAIVNAIEDALSPFGVTITETPVTPDKIVTWVEARRHEAAAV